MDRPKCAKNQLTPAGLALLLSTALLAAPGCRNREETPAGSAGAQQPQSEQSGVVSSGQNRNFGTPSFNNAVGTGLSGVVGTNPPTPSLPQTENQKQKPNQNQNQGDAPQAAPGQGPAPTRARAIESALEEVGPPQARPQAGFGDPSQTPLSDQDLADRVRGILTSANPDIPAPVAFPNLENLIITAKDGVISLRGTVGTQQAKKGIEARVRKVPGVKDVNNHMFVAPESPLQPTPATREKPTTRQNLP